MVYKNVKIYGIVSDYSTHYSNVDIEYYDNQLKKLNTDLKIIPINVLHHKLQVFGYRFGDFTYITDANYISETEIENGIPPYALLEYMKYNKKNDLIKGLTKEGMYLQNGQAIFAVYSIDKVLALLNIFPQDVAFIKPGDKVFISVETNPSNVISSKSL